MIRVSELWLPVGWAGLPRTMRRGLGPQGRRDGKERGIARCALGQVKTVT